uniref:CAB/ELIP/HLIP superfamily protein n=1 Tax=Hypnea cervicornis TaxID=387623 RepID=UPI0021B55BA4|nr:CAB/ELIP/HLIP superfamily protein [Hypnea cervicornis]UVW80637.1 CAB/ELIP/HLIP superfamily protein [Hypnea cervicornis]
MLNIISSFINFRSSNNFNKWTWGFSQGAESWNGRLAMIAFCIIFYMESKYSFAILYFLGL